MATHASKASVKSRRKPPDGVNRRRVKTPLLLQMHATECGAACLGSVLAFFGRWAPLAELRDRCEVSRDGSSAAGIVRAARHYGLECRGRSVRIRELKKLSLPVILFWEFRHFLILEGQDRDHYYLNDPSIGRRKLTAEEFRQGFTGVALFFRRTAGFRPGGARRSALSRLPGWLRGTGRGLAYAIACGLMLALLALATPALLAVVVDRILGEGQPWGMLAAGVMAAAAVAVYALTLTKQRILRRLAVRMSIIAGDRCVSRLLRLPVEFFNNRLVGELSARVLSIDKISRGLSEHFLGVMIEMGMSVVFLAVMLFYDAPLALIVLALGVLNASLVWLIARVRSDESHALRREQGLLLGVGTLMLNQTETLRMTAADDRFFARWSGHQARELAARQRFIELSHIISALPGLFLVLSNAAVLAFGATRVMSGELTLGVLVGFYVLAGMFLAPVGRFVESSDERQALETDMQRLDDITDSSEDQGPAAGPGAPESVTTLNGRLRLAGRVELKNITFGYNPARPPLIEDFSLEVRPGQRIAIVGPSGSGKSTIARLLAGLHQPWSGEILFDGRPRSEIPEEVLFRSVSLVDQETVLFSATVRDNITLWSSAVPDHDLVAAARDACIHEEILARPLGYATPVEEDGGNFSGGQRQRLEIARALVGNPTVLITDEATGALDAATEESVDDALRRRGVTRLIVAHRLSTVRDCDQIIVLDQGREVQRGAHDELMADRGGTYYRLVRAV